MAHKVDRKKGILTSINPSTLQELGQIPLATPEDVEIAVQNAKAAFPSWAALTIQERAKHLIRARDYMLDRVEEICKLLTDEAGKPRSEALTAEVLVVSDLINLYTKRAPELLADRPIPLANPLLRHLKNARLAYEPLGVVAVVSPWNYPFSIPMSGILMSLLAGNTVVFKPASDTAMIGKKIEEILNIGGGLPPGVLNTLIATGSTMGEKLFSPPVKKVVFTGSTEVGKMVHSIAAKNLIPTVMELGGNDAMIVCHDADVELAAKGAVWGGFTNCGQVCASVERIYVHESIHDAFLEQVVDITSKLRVGYDTGKHDVEIGPLANQSQLETVTAHVQDAVDKGAKVMCGGGPVDDLPGYFYKPTVLSNCNPTMKVVNEETFGPVLVVIPFKAEAEAIRLANDSNYGLTGSVWTKDLTRGLALARQFQAGSVLVNDVTFSYALVDTPWQGMKESGMGRSHSDDGLLEFVFPKHINIDHSPSMMRRRMWWFPYSPAGYDLLKKALWAFLSPKHLPKLFKTVVSSKEARKTLM